MTCSSLGSIWLNESFATFCHTIWNGHAHGEDDLTYQRWRYLNKYLGYVQKTGTVRPMEYFKYRAPHEMYQTETTYLKGSLVLHMLRHFVGDADFFRSLTAYLRKHEYQSVDSAALKKTFDETCGTNLTWFFDDWIIGGGGHPVLDVTCLWSAERRQIDLSVAQMQTNLPFENDFRLPVDVEIFTAAGSKTHGIVLEGWSTHASLPAESKPLAVVFDKGNWLIGELRFRRTLREVLYQLERSDLAGKLRAARDLATDFAGHSESAAALARILGDTGAHWGLRQEAALDLGRMTIAEARSALVRASADPDRRIRRAVAIALGTAAGVESETALRRMIETDPTEDVAAASEISLGRLHAAGAGQLFARQLSRDSRYWNSIRLGALIGLAQLGDPELASSFQSYTDPKWEAEVRLAALDGWHRARADDPALPARLRDLARDRNREVRLNAIGRIGELHRPADLRFLRELAESDSDPDISEAARSAAEVIDHFVRKEK